MASLQRHVVNGRTYWRIVESRRVNGKPRAVPVLYLGTADALLDRLLEAPAGRWHVRSFQHGDVAALTAAAHRLGIVSLIDKHVPRQQHRDPSVGTTLLLGAINRAVRPRSKRGWSAWAAETSLHRLFPGLKPDRLTSQFFWDQMNCVSLEALSAIEDELTGVVVRQLGIQLDTLLYDTTNFFTYIASTNTRSKLAQRGKSKQKRTDLRLFSLALLVSRDGQIPLCSQVYEGNKVDSKLFPDSLSQIRRRLADISLDLEDLTVVYDKGNMSKANQALVDEAPFGYVASLTPAHHSALMDIPSSSYTPIGGDSRLQDVPVHRLRREIWGAERTVVLLISEQLRAGQIRGLQQHLGQRLKALAEWKKQLSKPRSGPRTKESTRKRIDELRTGQYIHEVLHVEFDAERNGADRLRYWVDEQARTHLETEVFGKRILLTNRDEWSTEDIVWAYRGQHHVEAVFRQCKDDEHLAIRSQHHWTDHKIHVHTFLCLLALLLARVVEWEARKRQRTEGLSGLLELLSTVRLVMVLRSAGEKRGRPRTAWQLETGNKDATDFFRQIVPDKPPFVYTDSSP
ncbi:MAG: IS1634 family transposase [bacterium]|nr:IS1634 family transposase [bacterium]